MIFALLDSQNTPDFETTATAARTVARTVRMIIMQLVRATRRKTSLLWQMYYAKPDGTVLGVSQFNDPSTADSSSPSWQWGARTALTFAARTPLRSVAEQFSCAARPEHFDVLCIQYDARV